ncbi:stromal membrane-associated protein 1-like isoform X1 [Diadema antillarum]|uniref:stromal membrane-associated protein 1-like isoform X1 n=1 Tax=Diadema antillarum TaxID=105358 RepID=UPI003A889F17
MSRSHSEKDKKHQEKYQAILSRLLREEDNKYCVDCDAKGPRWASWNLGIFLCIRCAGIHRNLGVHISKVKSVNLDSWTEEQIQSMESVGNTLARKYYEANLPSSFRRPQTDSPLDNFIRAKYEHKKYIDKNMAPPGATKVKREDKENSRDSDKEKRKVKKAEKNNISIPRPSENLAPVRKHQSPGVQTLAAQAATVTAVQSAPTAAAPPPSEPRAAAPSSNQLDLFGLDAPASVGNGDLLGMHTPQKPPSNQISPIHNANPAPADNAIEESLFGTETKSTSSKASKESILALYGSSGQSSQPIYGVPGGMYIPSQQNQMVNGYPATGAIQQQGGIPQGGIPQQTGMPQQMAMQQPNTAYPQANNFGGMGMMAPPPHQGMMAGQGMMGNPSGMMGMYNPNQGHLQQQQQNMYLQQQQHQQQQAQAQALQQVPLPTMQQQQYQWEQMQLMHMQEMQMQQQYDVMLQVQAQMQNLRVGGGGTPQQAVQQPTGGGWGMPSNPPQASMQGSFTATPSGIGAAANGGMGWNTPGMSGQTLSTQLWK